jgi:hypothetical protein
MVCQWFGLETTGIVCQWLVLKTTRTVFSVLATKPMAMFFCGLASKPVATISPSLASKLVVSFLVEPQNQGGGGFSGLGLKTGSYGLVIWTSKSPRRFFGLGLKTKQTTVCWLRHETDGRATARDMCQDLAPCFTWEQVGLDFPNLASRLAEA